MTEAQAQRNRRPTPPSSAAGDTRPIRAPVQRCADRGRLKSIHIDIGWTFSAVRPTGRYRLQIDGRTFLPGDLVRGRIRIDNQLASLCGTGSLTITVTGGPTFTAPVQLDLPEIQDRTGRGLTRRLTNLGFYAGTDGVFDARARWAIRAFKRARINNFTRNGTVIENDRATQAFLTHVQAAYGAHPNDRITEDLAVAAVDRPSAPCRMFGSREYVYRRRSFDVEGGNDDTDPSDAGNGGIWGGISAAGLREWIAGRFTLFLRAFDPSAGESAIPNRVNLPQPIHMAQFVLFELGYWLIGGRWPANNATRNTFCPNGDFHRDTQWAVREFQCHAKFARAAKEDVASREQRYLPRLFANSPVDLSRIPGAQYPELGRVSGAINLDTRNALQAWADNALRCPVIIYGTRDTTTGADLTRIDQENLWLHNDHLTTGLRMYAIDYSGRYTIPARHGGNVSSGGYTFPRPIVLGYYDPYMHGGGKSEPPQHCWNSEFVEVRPDTMIGAGGADGVNLTPTQRSTFKVVRTASHFECYAYVDAFNAYDDVTISFGPCHWTLARCLRVDPDDPAQVPNEQREMPAFFAYMRHAYPAAYDTHFKAFGLIPERAWTAIPMSGAGTYVDRITIQIEFQPGTQILCGAGGTEAEKFAENTYCKNWHAFYRFQMACRTSAGVRRAMWDFTRIRIRNIIDKLFTITIGNTEMQIRVRDYVTSEKGVAMLLRWHIFRPAHVYGRRLQTILTNAIQAHPGTSLEQRQAREDAILLALSRVDVNFGREHHLAMIHGWTDVPQQGLLPHYHLNLASRTLSGAANSFQFDRPT